MHYAQPNEQWNSRFPALMFLKKLCLPNKVFWAKNPKKIRSTYKKNTLYSWTCLQTLVKCQEKFLKINCVSTICFHKRINFELRIFTKVKVANLVQNKSEIDWNSVLCYNCSHLVQNPENFPKFLKESAMKSILKVASNQCICSKDW